MRKYADELRSHLESAVRKLQAAKDSLEDGQGNPAISDAAESAFHVASALLLNEGIEMRSDADASVLVQEVFVQKRRLTKEQGADLSWLLALENVEDHARFEGVSMADAQRAIRIAASFFEAARVILET